MTKHRPHQLEPEAKPRREVVRVHVGRGVAIDLFANAALRWLCRAGIAQAVRVVAVVR
jgi:hypothetical protein